MQPEERKVITMNQQIPDRARQELRAIFRGIFDHVLRKEKETAILNASRIDDSVITTKVKALLAKDAFLKSFQISVETYQGTVQLSRFVNSQKAVDKAGSITRASKG